MVVPKEISGARVILFAPERNLAICQYEGDDGFYLFGCDENWNSESDTWHSSLDDAKKQAAFEYEGIEPVWHKPK